jgi:hypothetical protein
MPRIKDEPDTAIRLPEQAERILEILRGAEGEWMSRSEIAEKLGKKVLNPGEMAYMEIMELNNLIESKTSDARTPTGWQWVYRAVDTGSE